MEEQSEPSAYRKHDAVTARAYARPIGLVVLVAVTAYGLYELFTGDWPVVMAEWRDRWPALAGAMALGVLDVAIGALSWVWVYRQFGIACGDRTGLKVFFSGYAALLLPMKLGNLIRPDAFVRLGRAPLGSGVKAEAVLFFLDATAASLLLAGWGTYLVYPLLSPVAALVAVGAVLALADRAASLVSGTRLELPADFGWRWPTLGVLFLRVGCWTTTGFALYILIRGLSGEAGCVETLFYVPASSVLGTGMGLPGGVGAIEGLLGVSLRMMHVPAAHLAFAVGAFRLATFWVWLPIGWVALMLVNRQAAGPRSTTPDGGDGEK